MDNGSYGSVRLADVDINDVDIFYTYMGSREFDTNPIVAKKLNAIEVLRHVRTEDNLTLDGMYTLKLPTDEFNELGVYNIVITPRPLRTTIVDNGVLTSRPDIRGIVINIDDERLSGDRSKMVNGGLDGFRIEYMKNGSKVRNTFRIITSSNKCEAITETTNNTNQKEVKYRFNDFSNLIFLTVTPSATSQVKTNTSPFIGDIGQEILIYNTFFDPIMLEVNIVDTTLETLKHGIYGNQIETKDGRLTIYTADEDKVPFKEYNLFTEKDEYDEDAAKIKMGVDNSNDESFDDYFNNIDLT